jgi:hypothetical protein|tara:strand:- start:8809 stop:9546 length:738 start_codon:yes stop_codon:yes gene_type:complete
MKPKLNAVIIGAGGVTSYMLPALRNSFDLHATIVDGDVLEKNNLDRQLFRNNMVGQHKCVALMKQYNFKKSEGQAIRSYFDLGMLDTEYKYWFSQADVIICAVDNHPARKAAIDAAKMLNTNIVVCANEYHTSQAFYYDPHLANQLDLPMLDPLVRYPEIATDTSGSPISCQGIALESEPQLAIANQVAASFGNYLLWQWFGVSRGKIANSDNTIIYMPIEFQSTFSRMQTITIQDVEELSKKAS